MYEPVRRVGVPSANTAVGYSTRIFETVGATFNTAPLALVSMHYGATQNVAVARLARFALTLHAL
jgi:hypothetical protein